MRRGESLTCKVSDPITEVVVTRCYEDDLLAVKGVEDLKCCPRAVAMGQQVR